MKSLFYAIAVWFGLHVPAEAHHRYHHHMVRAHSMVDGLGYGLVHMMNSMGRRPHAWCGYYMRELFGVSDPSYNLARNWVGYGRPAMGPHVGAIVVWRHHVGVITGGGPGSWVVKSGNDGHAVRERQRSLAGAIAFREQ